MSGSVSQRHQHRHDIEDESRFHPGGRHAIITDFHSEIPEGPGAECKFRDRFLATCIFRFLKGGISDRSCCCRRNFLCYCAIEPFVHEADSAVENSVSWNRSSVMEVAKKANPPKGGDAKPRG